MSDGNWSNAEKYLKDQDSVMGDLIERFGPCDLAPRSNLFDFICESIIWQQISIKVAFKIMERFRGLFSDNEATPRELLGMDDEQLRDVGVSKPKISYMKNVAHQIVDGDLNLDSLKELSNKEIGDRLKKIKGIGPWTVTMFLIFGLNRENVLPVGDLGIKNAIQKYYGLKERPTAKEVKEIGQSWQPYSSVAAWYLWISTRED